MTGFCWGGGKSFAFAAHRKGLSAAFVFYGPGPADVTTVTAPVYGFYAGNDARIDATVPVTAAAMKAAGKTYGRSPTPGLATTSRAREKIPPTPSPETRVRVSKASRG